MSINSKWQSSSEEDPRPRQERRTSKHTKEEKKKKEESPKQVKMPMQMHSSEIQKARNKYHIKSFSESHKSSELGTKLSKDKSSVSQSGESYKPQKLDINFIGMSDEKLGSSGI